MEPRSLRERIHIGKGQETDVWSSRRGDRQSGIVTKEYSGIDDERRIELEQQYQRLRSVYGDLIPRQRFIKKDQGRSLVLAQERVQPAKPQNVLDYTKGALPPRAQQQLEQLIRILRAQWKIFVQNKYAVDDYTLLDFAKKDNLLVTEDGEIRFVDTGTAQEYSRLSDAAAVRMIQAPIALMEMIAGKSGEDIMSDPEYSGLVYSFERTGYMYADKGGMTAFERFVHDAYDGRGVLLMH